MDSKSKLPNTSPPVSALDKETATRLEPETVNQEPRESLFGFADKPETFDDELKMIEEYAPKTAALLRTAAAYFDKHRA